MASWRSAGEEKLMRFTVAFLGKPIWHRAGTWRMFAKKLGAIALWLRWRGLAHLPRVVPRLWRQAGVRRRRAVSGSENRHLLLNAYRWHVWQRISNGGGKSAGAVKVWRCACTRSAARCSAVALLGGRRRGGGRHEKPYFFLRSV
jgi:hypothetical protein